jgi:pyridoxamine 5'-phosphate oxidase
MDEVEGCTVAETIQPRNERVRPGVDVILQSLGAGQRKDGVVQIRFSGAITSTTVCRELPGNEVLNQAIRIAEDGTRHARHLEHFEAETPSVSGDFGSGGHGWTVELARAEAQGKTVGQHRNAVAPRLAWSNKERMPTSIDLTQLRREYSHRGLLESELNPDPLAQFRGWLAEAVEHQLIEPNAMILATVDADGQPWSRTVLLKACDERGFTFFTNYQGAKAQQLEAEPRCALTFWWAAHERQVNVAGRVEKVARAETEEYFKVRPLLSRLGAWASQQSTVIDGRESLERAFAEAQARFGDNVPAPPHWGGYVVRPISIEFWQGRQSRLHDRLRYSRQNDGTWKIDRLSP